MCTWCPALLLDRGVSSSIPSRDETFIMYPAGVDGAEGEGEVEEGEVPITGRSSRQRIRGTKALTEWALIRSE